MTDRTKKLFLLGAIISAIILFFVFDLDRYLSFEALRENQQALRDFVAAAPYLSAGLYIAAYIIIVAFSLPGAIWMTLAGGLLFGTWIGGGLTIIGATLGAAILFLVARYLLGDFFRARAASNPSLQKFEAAFNRDAVSYLLALRLLPIFPFFIVNLGAALFGARFFIFVLTTFFGIMPGTFVFASIGAAAGHLIAAGTRPDLAIVTQPAIIGPLAALAALVLLPIVYRKIKK